MITFHTLRGELLLLLLLLLPLLLQPSSSFSLSKPEDGVTNRNVSAPGWEEDIPYTHRGEEEKVTRLLLLDPWKKKYGCRPNLPDS